MRLKINLNRKFIVILLFLVILVLNIIMKERFYDNFNIYAIAFCICFASYDVSIVLFIMGITGFLGLQMSGTDDFAVVAVLASIVRMAVSGKGNLNISNNSRRVAGICILIMGMMLINIFVSHYRWGQPILVGLIASRRVIEVIGIAVYYILYASGKYEKLRIHDTITSLCTISCLMIIIQYREMERIQFLPVQFATRGNEGLDRILIHNAAPLICLLAGMQLYEFMDRKKAICAVNFGIYVYTLLVVAKGRMIIIALLMEIGFILFYYGKGGNRHIKNFLLIVVMGIVIFLLANELWGYISGKFMSDFFLNSENYVRVKEIKAYMSIISEHILWGGGLYSANYSNPAVEALLKNRLFVSDIGIFGDFYNYGILGIFSILITYILLIKSYFIKKNVQDKNRIAFSLIIMFGSMWTVPFLTYISLISLVLLGNQNNREAIGG